MFTFPTTMFAGGAAFSPLDVDNIIGWWDFSDTSTVTAVEAVVDDVPTGDYYITQVDDKSGEDNHVTNGESGTGPWTSRPKWVDASTGTYTVNGLRVASYNMDDLINTAMGFTDTGERIYFIVATFTATAAQYPWAIGAAASFYQHTNVTPSSDQWQQWSYTTTAATSTTLTGTTWTDPHLFTSNAITDASTPYGKLYFDGVYNVDYVAALGSAVSADRVNLGNLWGTTVASYGFTGMLCEAIVYDTGAMSDADIASIHTYLLDKWGI